MLVRCIYASRAAQSISPQFLDMILKQSWENNPTLGITGLLCFTSKVFVQALEGSREAVSHLYNKIARDERHNDITILLFEEIVERKFGSWTMGNINVDIANPALVLKYSDMAELDPFNSSGPAIKALLIDLVSSGSI